MSDSEIPPGTQESKAVRVPVGMLCELPLRFQGAVADMERKGSLEGAMLPD